MLPEWLYILGPGTTTRGIAELLGFRKTLVGVDVIANTGLVLFDATERQIIELLAGRDPPRAKIVVSPIGGQGFLFGRGNQQISPAVIRKVGRDNIIIVCLPGKLAALGGRPLLVDSGDPELDQMLAGYYCVITGYQEQAVINWMG
jgi:predicted polyphosphate/ATP-dependent NAD kinase